MASQELINKALAVRSWALKKRLMPIGALSHDVAEDDLILAAQAFGDDLPVQFERRGLTGVGVSDISNTIIIYTAGALRVSDKKILPASLDDDTALEYRRASPFSLKDDTPAVGFGMEPSTRRRNRYTCGSSISVANRRSAGTMGCLVRKDNGELYGLTNNHITGGCNNTRLGMPIAAPGIKDVSAGSEAVFSIGSHFATIPMMLGDPDAVDHATNTDAAIFRITDERKVSSMQRGFFDTPTEFTNFTADPENGTRVKKVGRTTGLTHGYIESRQVGPFPLTYDITTYHGPSESVRFSGRVYFEPVFVVRGTTGIFSDRGDSGALVVTDIDGGEQAVGIVFAGDSLENLSYILPIEPIMKQLGLQFVSNHGIS